MAIGNLKDDSAQYHRPVIQSGVGINGHINRKRVPVITRFAQTVGLSLNS